MAHRFESCEIQVVASSNNITIAFFTSFSKLLCTFNPLWKLGNLDENIPLKMFRAIETDAKNLRLVFLFITQKRLMIELKDKLEVKIIGQEL